MSSIIFDKAVEFIKENDTDKLKQLIEENPSILQEKDEYDSSLLHIAVKRNNIEIAKILADHGADVNSRDSYSWTVLHIAIMNRNIDMIKLLIEREVDLNAREIRGWTAAILAFKNKRPDIVKLLILHGANPYLKDNNDKTILDYIEDKKTKNELLFIYHNREKILEEIEKQKEKGVEYDQF